MDGSSTTTPDEEATTAMTREQEEAELRDVAPGIVRAFEDAARQAAIRTHDMAMIGEAIDRLERDLWEKIVPSSSTQH